MPTFSYKARNASGHLVRGSMDAASKDEIISKLHRMGYMPTQIQSVLTDLKLENLFSYFTKVGTEDMMIWNAQLSNLINAGIPLLSALDVVRQQTSHHVMREVTTKLGEHVDAGDSFSEALTKFPRIFSHLFVSMVRAGEASGKLDEVLASYAVYIESQYELKQKIQGALYYPAILLVVGFCVILYVVMTIIPEFVSIFKQAGVVLPLPTLVIYETSLYIRQHWLPMLVSIATLICGICAYVSTAQGKYHWDILKLKLPVLGVLFRRAAISRFSRTLGTLFASGVSILDSLDAARGVVGNELIGRAIDRARASVEKGERIGKSLREAGQIPPDALNLISAGEESGTLDRMLKKIAQFYDRYLGYAFKKLTTVFEPVLLCVLGAAVGFIMLSALLPMFDMIQVLRR